MNTEFKILNMNENILNYFDETTLDFYKKRNANQIAILLNKDEIDPEARLLSFVPIYIDDINDIDNKLTVYIGYTYSMDSKSTETLLKNVINYFKITGTEKIIGPIEKDIWYESSVKISKDLYYPAEPPMDHSPNVYEKLGFESKFKYYSYKYTNKIQKIEPIKKSNITIETISEKPTDKELKEIYNLISFSYQKNNFFKEINYNKFNDYQNFYEQFCRFYDTFFMDIKVAKYMDEIIGVIIGYTRTNKEYAIKSIAIHTNFQNNNIGQSLYLQLSNEKAKEGYDEIVIPMITNKKMEEKIINKYKAKKISTYCLYELNL